ncbi:MAG: hypothetical protein WAS21_33400 [Geminicoccaceae bacterium]
MPLPSAAARTLLDQCSRDVASAAHAAGVPRTLNDFHPLTNLRAKHARYRIRQSLTRWSGVLLCVLILVLVTCVFWPAINSRLSPNGGKELAPELFLTAFWSLALGGLGAVVNLFSIYLRLVPTETLIASDPFEVNGRIVLGSLFSMVISVTILAHDVSQFFEAVIQRENFSDGIGLLIPFFLGYAITLALAFMQKLISALEIAFSLEAKGQVRTRSSGG